MSPVSPAWTMGQVKSFELYMSYACDQDCIFCSESSRMGRFGRDSLSYQEMLDLIIQKKRAGYEHLTFVGGEPTIHSSFIRILSAAKRLKYQTLLITDGQKLARADFAAAVLPLLDELVFSLHGPSPDIHDALTRTPGSFDRIMRAITLVEKTRRKPFSSTSTVVTQTNFLHLEPLVDLALARSGIRGCLISNLTPNENEPIERYLDQVIRLKSLPELFERLVRVAEDRRKNIRFLGFPTCALGLAKIFSADFHLDRELGGERMIRERGLQLEDSRQYGPRRGRFFPKGCENCVLRDNQCLGLLSGYYNRFGASELQPVRRLNENG